MAPVWANRVFPADQVLANVSATWEKADKLNAGVDMAFLITGCC